MTAPSDFIVAAALVGGTGTAAVVDVADRRIPNAVSMGTAAVGFALAATGVSGVTLASSMLGFALGLLLMMPSHVLGATGAGDVKMFGAAGAVLGAGQIIEAFVFVVVAGGILALAVAWWRGRLRRTVAGTLRLFRKPAETRAAIESPAEHNRFPYGPAIAIGCVLSALL